MLVELIIVVGRRRYPVLRFVPAPLLRMAVRPKAREIQRRASAYATVVAVVAVGVVVG